MNKKLQHIKEHTVEIEPSDITSVRLCKNGDIDVVYKIDGVRWTGCLQKVNLNKDGEVTSYAVYIY